MQAQQLLSQLTSAPIPACEIDILTQDTRQANEKALFVCIRGARFDGHALADRAYENGCRFFVAEKPLALPDDAFVVTVKDSRRTLAELSCIFYGHPSKKLRVIGITGTKGKTTTAHLVRGLLEGCGIPCGYIGTNGILYGGVTLPTLNTTPDPITLQKTLADMADDGMLAAVIEISSQALLQFRADGIRFESVLFTNLSLDHVGTNEHATFEDYKKCKHRLFTDFEASYAIWNADDPAHADMRCGAVAKKQLFFSTNNTQADYSAQRITPVREKSMLGIAFVLTHKGAQYPCTLPLVGTCNVSNAVAAIAVAAEVFSLPVKECAYTLSSLRVDGRSESYPLPSGATAVIDYAHNEESLRAILTSLREYTPRRLICLFGSVGERSQLRRRALGTVASSLADFSVLTSDNPGNEPPEQIIDEIASAFEDPLQYCKIPDRRHAIAYALTLTKKNDILLLAGKGHERYQLIGECKRPFHERAILDELTKNAEIPTAVN